uniref:Cytochrome b6-f complex subunit 7 n=1 Tax=Hildenbrandia rivularis TaxID=135206 RepID=A0A1C9CFB0_9FLOR|nr:cytochrome B6-f complex subunit [Hildenbrandia rivularis]AOM67076.1 cytochrome B6-f complex subunit [Hildenbrandia rivularis]
MDSEIVKTALFSSTMVLVGLALGFLLLKLQGD